MSMDTSRIARIATSPIHSAVNHGRYSTCDHCGKEYRIGEWPFCPHGRPHGKQGGVVHEKERSIVYRHPGTGEVSYPGRNDEPMPQNLKDWGYERVEVGRTLRELEKFESEAGVRSDVAWYDNGTGNADKMPDVKPIDWTGLEITSAG